MWERAAGHAGWNQANSCILHGLQSTHLREGNSSKSSNSNSSSSSVGQSRKLQRPAEKALAVGPLLRPQTHSQDKILPNTAQLSHRGNWNFPQLEYHRNVKEDRCGKEVKSLEGNQQEKTASMVKNQCRDDLPWQNLELFLPEIAMFKITLPTVLILPRAGKGPQGSFEVFPVLSKMHHLLLTSIFTIWSDPKNEECFKHSYSFLKYCASLTHPEQGYVTPSGEVVRTHMVPALQYLKTWRGR